MRSSAALGRPHSRWMWSGLTRPKPRDMQHLDRVRDRSRASRAMDRAFEHWASYSSLGCDWCQRPGKPVGNPRLARAIYFANARYCEETCPRYICASPKYRAIFEPLRAAVEPAV